MSSEQAAVVTRFLEGFAAGDIAAALDCLAPDCVVDEAHEVFAGIYRRFDRWGDYRDDAPEAALRG